MKAFRLKARVQGRTASYPNSSNAYVLHPYIRTIMQMVCIIPVVSLASLADSNRPGAWLNEKQ